MTDGRLRAAAQAVGVAVNCTSLGCLKFTKDGMHCAECQAMIDRMSNITPRRWEHSHDSTPRPSHYIAPPPRPRITGHTFGVWYLVAVIVVMVLSALYALVTP